jgi:hydroxyethylthiazole kinase-like uncharacterized protein yjeF
MKNVFFNDDILKTENEIISSLGIPSLILMENAGKNSAGYIIKHFPSEIKDGVAIITGRGNNAGDGFAVARHLANNNISVKVLQLYPESDLKGDALVNHKILTRIAKTLPEILTVKKIKSVKEFSSEIKSNRLVVDAIFGVGFRGEFDERIKKVVRSLDSFSDKIIISLDVPSGLYNYDTGNLKVKADLTLTMGVKKFHSLFYNGKEASGKIEVMDIGVSGSEFTARNSKNIFIPEEEDVKKILPVRNVTSYKYSIGKVLVIGASVGLTGAAYLSSLAALKTGSGAVIAAVPESLYNIMEVKLTEGIILPSDETGEITLALSSYDKIKEKIDWADSVLAGPGLSKNKESLELVRKIVSENDKKFVIDADGIASVKDHLKILKDKKKKVILTPHLGEFSSLIGEKISEVRKNFYDIATNFAGKNNCILVLKNAPTIITDGKRFFINPTGRENLATVGTGDVLAGIIAGLYSILDDPFESAIAGAFIHGMCGDILYEKTGSNSTIAGELIEQIPLVKNKIASRRFYSRENEDPGYLPFKKGESK